MSAARDARVATTSRAPQVDLREHLADPAQQATCPTAAVSAVPSHT
jgi:hypothetical protein